MTEFNDVWMMVVVHETSDETKIRGLLEQIYSTPSGKALLDVLVNTGETLYFEKTPGAFEATIAGFKVFYDWTYLNGQNFLDKGGGTHEVLDVRAIAHELVHAIYGLDDIVPHLTDYTTPGTNYSGQTVLLENHIMSELGDSWERVSYTGALSNAELADLGMSPGSNLVAGGQVDLAIVAHKWSEIDVSDRIDNALLIGVSTDDDIKSGSGTDYLYGGGGNDILQGNGGQDKLYGNAGADILFGGLAQAGFTPTMTSDISTYHAEWDDGRRDFLYGGAGADYMLSASNVLSTGDIFLLANGGAPRAPDNLASILTTIDFVDGTDVEYTANVQFNATSGGYLFNNFSWTAQAMHDALEAGGITVELGQAQFYQGGSAGSSALTVNGLRVDSAQDGTFLLLAAGQTYLTSYIAGVTGLGARNLSDSQEGWVVTGKGGAGAGLLSDSRQSLLVADADTLYGGNSPDSIYAYSGNDTIVLGQYSGGLDYVDGGIGVDTVNYAATSANLAISIANVTNGSANGLGSNNNDTLVGIENIISGSGNDTLTGSSIANTLDGGAGTDTISGGAGADILIGGSGNDVLIVDSAGDTTVEYANGGIDQIVSSISWTLTAGNQIENLDIEMNAVNATGNELNNVIDGSGVANMMYGLDGNDTIYGDDGADTVYGGNGNDAIYGENGNDRLDGGAGSDTMYGGDGADSYFVDSLSDVVSDTSGAEVDRVYSSISWTLTGGSNVEALALMEGSALNATGNAEGNELEGNEAANSLYGLGGGDLLFGFGGNDILDGGVGTDLMYGGAANDTYIVDASGDSVTEYSNEGTADIVMSSVTFILGNHIENLTLTGSGAINGTGNTLVNTITGNTLNNLLDGGSGADMLIGGAGDDTYVVDDSSDVVTEATSAGTDTVVSSISYSVASLVNLENITLTGLAAISAIGNASSNRLIGTAGANVLDGGIGADTLVGGAGNDTYIVDNNGDVVTEYGLEGTDTVQSAITFSVAALANVENITLTGTGAIDAFGNSLNNLLNGNSSVNTLDGGIGSDTLVGGGGDDDYYVDNTGDRITEVAGGGKDRVFSSLSWALTTGDNIEVLNLTAVSAISGTGNELDNTIRGSHGDSILYGLDGNDTIFGNAGDDTISGGNGNDEIYGENGGDTLNGGVGNDAMYGGDGNDRYYIDNVGDSMLDTAGSQIDVAYSSISWTLVGGSNVEVVVLTGSTALNAVGNEFFNELDGNNAANTLSGLGWTDNLFGEGGNDILDGGIDVDWMYGGTGNDTYIVDNAADHVVEYSNEGTDIVLSSASFILGADVENLTLTGNTAINGTGNSLTNIIIGNASNNVLDGGAGADSLTGGAGNDTYLIDNAGDVVTEIASGGTDLIQSSFNIAALAANVENLTFNGTVAIDGTGNGLDNIINGNNGVNSLSGGNGADTINAKNGADTLNGGGGNDVLDGGNGGDNLTGGGLADTFFFAVGSGTDTVTDFTIADLDIINLSAISEIININDLRTNHATDMGSYVVLDWNSDSDTVRLNGIANISDLVSANFVFA